MTKKSFLFIGLSSLLFAVLFISWLAPHNNLSTIKGTVTAADSGEPLIAVSILVKGTTIGTVTDIDGKYQLEIPKGGKTLVFSYTGFTPLEIAINGQSQIDVQMQTDGVTLDEVVVTGYGISRKKDTTSSVAAAAPASESKRSRKKNKREAQKLGANMMARSQPTPIVRKPGGRLDNTNTEDYSTINENRFQRPTDTPLSTFSIDVDAASYSNLRRFLNSGQMPPKDAVRIEEMVNYFDYNYPKPQGYEPFTVNTELGECPWNSKHRLLHVGLQGKQMPTAQLPASNLVFLLDVSGSMNAENKLPLLKESLKMLVDNLRPSDKVAIVVYAGAAGVVLPATKGTNKQAIKEALQQLEAGGSTAGGAGIKLAYKIARENLIKSGNNRVILATDGDFNVGASSDADLVRMIEKERESGIFLTVLGFGMGNYKDNKMQQLADKGNGNHAYIDNLNEAKKVLVSEFGGTLFTIAKDVKLQIEFNPSKVAGYRLIGYENRLLNDEDFADDTKDAGELGAGHTVTALYEIIPAGVESEFLADVGDLKYQEKKTIGKNGQDLCTIKLRYKQPSGSTSKLLEEVVVDSDKTKGTITNNFQWSAAVAQFGMLLRDSQFKGSASFESCQNLAERAKGEDHNGYRAEMIKLIKKAGKLETELVAEK